MANPKRIKDQAIRSEIGSVIKLNRLRGGLSQKELAQMSSLTREYINMIEKGERVPSDDSLKRISGAFGKKVTELVEEIGPFQERDNLHSLLLEIIDDGDIEELKQLVMFAQRLSETSKAFGTI